MGVAGQEDELGSEPEITEPEDDTLDSEPDEGQEEPGAGDEDEDVVQIGSEEPPASEEAKAAPQWVKELRRNQRDLVRENAELKAKLGAGEPAVKQVPKLPPKPTLAGADYDEEQFQAAMDGWYATKRDVEAHEASQKSAAEERQKAAQSVHANYAKSKAALKVSDFQDAEDQVVSVLDTTQQSILIAGAENAAAMVFALGKSPKKLQELASIKDPVKFAVAVGKLETDVKVTKRTSTKPAPESTVRTGSGSAAVSTATLERLEAEAAKTGDRSKVIAYKRQRRGK